MKNRVLLLSCLLISGFANAQFSTGQKVIGGQLNLSVNNSYAPNSPGADQKTTTGGIALSLSQFKSPLRLIGFGVQYAYSDTRYNSTSSSPFENKNNAIGAFVEFTKLQPLAKKLYLSFTGTGGANYTIADAYYPNNIKTETKGYSLYINGGMGLWYQLTNRFVLTGSVSNLLSLSYGHGKTTSYQANNTSVVSAKNDNFALTTGLSNFSLGSFGFGVRYLLK
ncbi:MAG: hypothetical protein V4450_02145 [Bacteroidota bacterium]